MFKFITFFMVLLSANYIYSEISIDKSFILFNNANKNHTINVHNASNTIKYYQLEFMHHIMQENGEYKEVEPNKMLNLADDLIIVTPKKITINAKSSQTIRLQQKPTIELANGDYISFILIKEIADPNTTAVNTTQPVNNNQNLSIQLTPRFGISFPVIVRKGEQNYNLTVSNFKIITKNNANFLQITVNRSGLSSARGNFYIKNGKKNIGMVINVNIFATNNSRTINIPIDNIKLFNTLINKPNNSLKLEYVDSTNTQFNFILPIIIN